MLPRVVFLDDARRTLVDVEPAHWLEDVLSRDKTRYETRVPIPAAARYAVLRPGRCASILHGLVDASPDGEMRVGLVTEPFAVLVDSGSASTVQDAGQFFAAVAIDGRDVSNAFSQSSHLSAGRGSHLSASLGERYVAARSLRVRLEAGDLSAAPASLFARWALDQYHRTSGEVDFVPRPGGLYVVKGESRAEDTSVWIEDATTGEHVTPTITQHFTPRVVAPTDRSAN